MARYDSSTTEVPGQYPTQAWHEMELPEQNFGSGAAGTSPPSDQVDTAPESGSEYGATNQPGQYPDRDSFTGTPYSLGGRSGSGAPGSQGASGDGQGGPDTVAYDLPTLYKGVRDNPGSYDRDGDSGYSHDTISATVSGKGDWTQANPQGYQADDSLQMPGVAGNTPGPGSGQYQTDGQNGSGHVMYGGFLNGKRPATSRHPSFSGPGS